MHGTTVKINLAIMTATLKPYGFFKLLLWIVT